MTFIDMIHVCCKMAILAIAEKIELVELTKWLKWLDGLDWYKRFMGLTIYFYIFVVEISILVEMIAELSWIGLVELCEMAGFCLFDLVD